ncbi:adhesion G protein-coupled receptor E3-like isoform X1 [Notamacropus eugenii]|uniref:adhesion G protein-coupled receptor E3-like isoform X1 n=1 Tax=Notamacropus eugenii TaxID=9315 RepID=UPI003B67C15B
MGIRCPLLLPSLCVLVLLETAAAQNPKDSQCRRRCPQNATCINGTRCACDDGFASTSGEKYFSDPLEICDDVNECVPPVSISCGPHADCCNTEGSYHCICLPGYALPSGEKTFPNATMNDCQDINECASPINASCGPNAGCVNTIGSYQCICNPGYTLPSGRKTFPKPTMNNCQEVSLPQNPGGSSKLENISIHLEALITINESSPAEKKRVGTKVTKLLQELEQAALEDALSSPKTQVAQNNSFLAFETLVISNCSLENGNIRLEAQNNSVEISCMDIHSDTQGRTAVAFLSYFSLGTVINASFFEESQGKKSYGVYLNSQVVSTAVRPQQSNSSKVSVLLSFKHIQKKKAEETPLCVYWKALKEEGGSWSEDGCKLHNFSETHTRCNCNHTSTFAVLMALNSQAEDSVLTVITYVGLSLSLLCLFLAALTFLLCRAIQGTSTSLHLQLSLCLFLADLIFLTGIKQTKNQRLCSIIAGLLHYFYLASFTWMLLEGLHLFLTARNLMVVNYTRVSQSMKKVMYPLGYGIPAVIVAISALSRAHLYGSPSHCWIQTNKGFLWAFLGPVCTIFSVNFIFILLVLWILHSKLSSLNSEVSTIQDTRMLTFKALAQLCILGCTWCLGVLQIGPAAGIMAYLFTIINSLQGVFIFLVYCLLNHQVQQQYKKWFMTIKQTQSGSESLMLSSKVASGSTQTHTEN